jgi:hypothetical protein
MIITIFGQKNENFREALLQQDAEKASLTFCILLSSIPWPMHVQAEGYYHTIFFLTLALIGQPLQVEESGGDGDVDAVLDVPGGNILVIEMKHLKLPKKSGKEHPIATAGDVTSESDDHTPPTDDELFNINKLLDEGVKEALAQINNKKYVEKYQGIGRKITKVAIAVCKRTYVRVVFEDTISKIMD